MVAKTFLIALLSLTGLIPTDLPAQDSGCTRRTVAVGVADRQWNLVQGLGAANFRGSLHGHGVQILSATVDANPRKIVVLLDASGSMTDHEGDGWKTERTISGYLIRFAPAQASIAFLGFSRTVLDTEGFDQDAGELLKRLSALVKVCEQRRKGLQRTALYDAIASARDLLRAPNLGDVICPLTDAEDNMSQTTPRRVQEELLTAGVRLFGIVMLHVPQVRGRTPEEATGPDRLHSMVEATGGNTLFVPYGARSEPYDDIRAKTPADAVDLALQRLFQQMGEFYRLEVSLPGTVEKPTKWKLEVIDAGGKPMRGVEIHYPQELMPCANVGG